MAAPRGWRVSIRRKKYAISSAMPELPEVEVTRKRCEQVLKGKRLAKVLVHDDPIVFCGQPASELQAKLQGKAVLSCKRKGKYFWWNFASDEALVLHLGMTGAVHIPELADLQLSHGIEFAQDTWPPRFAKLEIELETGQALAFCDPRRFGRIRWQKAPLQHAPLCNLGLDPIADPFAFPEFYAQLRRRKGVIKGLLLNQSFVAGIGNWIADEVLYEAKIAPGTLVPDLCEQQAKALYFAIRTVIEHAVKVDADAQRFPEHWLFHKRWKPTPGQLDARGQSIEFCKIAGRSTAWVPSSQGPQRAKLE